MRDGHDRAAPELIGRQVELTLVERYVGRLAASAPELGPGLVIEGPAGIGKTALWLAAVDHASRSGVAVLSARPSEAESTFAYAALADMLRDLLPDLLPPMPAQQRRPLELALGLADTTDQAEVAVSPGLVQAAATNGLLALAAQRPILIAVDDAPWLDAPSAAVLQFLARRIGGRAIGFVVSQRSEEPAPAPLGLDDAVPGRPVERLWLENLSVGALHLLLAERLDMTLPRPHLLRLHELSGGVPFHALEIARALRGRPLPPAGAPLPIPPSIRELLTGRAQHASAPARELLLLVAAAGTLADADATTLLGTEAAADAIATSVDEGLLSIEDGVLRAAHPLIASTVYEIAGPRERREAHAHLAEIGRQPEERARHRALATTRPDDVVASELEAAGRQARRRGAPEAAADLLRLARERTPPVDREAWIRRSLGLADALKGAADLPAARRVLDELVPAVPLGRTLAETHIMRSEIEWYTGTSIDAVAELQAGLVAAVGHADLEADIHYRLAIFYDYDTRRAIEHAQKAVELAQGMDRPSLLASALMQLFMAEVWLGMPPRTELLDRALEIEPHDTADANTIPGIWWLALDRTDEARRRFSGMLARDRLQGDLSGEADLLTKLAEVELLDDSYVLARELADAATAAARQQGQLTADPARRVRALVDAHQGRLDEARAIAQPAAARATESGDYVIALAWLVVLAFIAASEADHEALERVTAESEAVLAASGGVDPLRLSVRHERPEALIGLGRLDEAAEVLDALEQRQRLLPRPWLEAALVRGRALMLAARGDSDGAVASTDLLLTPQVAGWRRFDRARTLLVRGQLLRRSRARREAAAALDEAVRLFEQIGAPVWAGRARAESERLGRTRGAAEGLTPTEFQVASLAASGLTNREVAEHLSVSPKTVEAHLARSYAKLGIRSRAELGRLMADRALDGPGG